MGINKYILLSASIGICFVASCSVVRRKHKWSKVCCFQCLKEKRLYKSQMNQKHGGRNGVDSPINSSEDMEEVNMLEKEKQKSEKNECNTLFELKNTFPSNVEVSEGMGIETGTSVPNNFNHHTEKVQHADQKAQSKMTNLNQNTEEKVKDALTPNISTHTVRKVFDETKRVFKIYQKNEIDVPSAETDAEVTRDIIKSTEKVIKSEVYKEYDKVENTDTNFVSKYVDMLQRGTNWGDEKSDNTSKTNKDVNDETTKEQKDQRSIIKKVETFVCDSLTDVKKSVKTASIFAEFIKSEMNTDLNKKEENVQSREDMKTNTVQSNVKVTKTEDDNTQTDNKEENTQEERGEEVMCKSNGVEVSIQPIHKSISFYNTMAMNGDVVQTKEIPSEKTTEENEKTKAKHQKQKPENKEHCTNFIIHCNDLESKNDANSVEANSKEYTNSMSTSTSSDASCPKDDSDAPSLISIIVVCAMMHLK